MGIHCSCLGNLHHTNGTCTAFSIIIKICFGTSYCKKNINVNIILVCSIDHVFRNNAVDGTRWVRWRTEQEHLGLVSDEALQLGRCDLEVLLLTAQEWNIGTFGQLHHLEVRDPGWRWDDDLVALLDNREDDVADLLFGTITNYDLCRTEFDSILALQLVADGLTQGHISWHGRIEREVVIDSLFGSLFDVIGCVEIRFTHTEVDDVKTLGLEFLALLQGLKGTKLDEVMGYRCYEKQTNSKIDPYEELREAWALDQVLTPEEEEELAEFNKLLGGGDGDG